jgi:energy-coupling factor transport system ATP-binding protein
VATAAGALNGRGSGLVRGGAPIASLRALTHRYRNGPLALRGVDLDLYPGECVAIIGQNGAGKTTLAKHLIGLLRPTGGEVRVLGRDTRSLTTAQVARHVGYLFQDPDYQIFCPSVVEEAAFGLQARGVPAVEARRRAMRELERVGLADLADAHPYRLSRGQRQLLALASVLACEPALLVVDEPSTGLDYYQTRRIMEHLDAYRAGGRSVVLITHDIEMVARYAQRCVVLKEGRVLAEAPVEELGDLTDELLAAGVRLPEVYEFLAALDLPPTFCEAEALADWLAGEPSANARRSRAVQPQLGRG